MTKLRLCNKFCPDCVGSCDSVYGHGEYHSHKNTYYSKVESNKTFFVSVIHRWEEVVLDEGILMNKQVEGGN